MSAESVTDRLADAFLTDLGDGAAKSAPNPGGRPAKKQTGRMRKMQCLHCDFIDRRRSPTATASPSLSVAPGATAKYSLSAGTASNTTDSLGWANSDR